MLEMYTAYTDTNARRDASRVSLAPGKRQHCVLDALERRPVETKKNRPGTMRMSQNIRPSGFCCMWLARRSGTHWQMNCELTLVIGLN